MGVFTCFKTLKMILKDKHGMGDDPVHVRHHLVVGVDFGTTNTGVAFSFSDNPDHREIEVITTWPSVGPGINETRVKVPSEISYPTDPTESPVWGYMFRPGAPRVGCFKLLLDPAAGDAKYNDEGLIDPGNPSAVMTLPPGKTVVGVCTDYLAQVYAHTMRMLEKRLPNTLKSTPIQFVITTPAMWGTNAQHNTLVAAKAAGFGKRSIDWVDMVSEPEAAAAYSLKQLNTDEVRHVIHDEKVGNEKFDEHHDFSDGSTTDVESESSYRDSAALLSWRPNTQLIVCDAGGGTVDLVAYEITQIHPYLKVDETVQAKGGLCGSTALDRAFLQLVRTRLGPQQDSLLTTKRTGRGSRMMSSWETAKKTFGSATSRESRWIEHGIWDILENEEMGITDEEIKLTHQDMVDIFDPTVRKVISLVSDVAASARKAHPDKPVAGVVLVGGFGESCYLYQKIKEWANDQKRPIFVCNPRDSWSAIAKGAVSYGLEPILHRRILKCHYGVELDVVHNPAIHDASYTCVCSWDGKTVRNNDTIEWFASMGQAVDKDETITVPFFIAVADARRRSSVTNVRLRTCRYNAPPMSRRDPTSVPAPHLRVALGALPDSSFSRCRVTNGTVMRKLNCKLKMVVKSASIVFEVKDSKTGKVLCTQNFEDRFAM